MADISEKSKVCLNETQLNLTGPQKILIMLKALIGFAGVLFIHEQITMTRGMGFSAPYAHSCDYVQKEENYQKDFEEGNGKA